MDGYRELFTDLKNWLRSITGFSGVSLQPNAGAQGEFAGLNGNYVNFMKKIMRLIVMFV